MDLPKLSGSAFCPSGIEPQGNTVLQPAHFTVQTVDAGVGEVLVYIEDPEGHTEEVWRGHWGLDRDHRPTTGMAWRWLPELPSMLEMGDASPWGLQELWAPEGL